MLPSPLGFIVSLAVWLALATATTATPYSRVPSSQMQQHLENRTTSWPALRFHFVLKRSSMNVYGLTEFDMSATPVVSDDGTKMLYDAFTTFTEGTFVYNYSLVNGIAFLSSRSSGEQSSSTPSWEYLESESGALPPINTIVAAVNEATELSSTTDSGV